MYVSFIFNLRHSCLLFIYSFINISQIICISKIHARTEAIEAGHADYAIQVTENILKYYQNIFGLKYPLKKIGESMERNPIHFFNELFYLHALICVDEV